MNVFMSLSPDGSFHYALQVNWHFYCVCTTELASGSATYVHVALESPFSPSCLARAHLMLIILAEIVMASHFTVKDAQVWKMKYMVSCLRLSLLLSILACHRDLIFRRLHARCFFPQDHLFVHQYFCLRCSKGKTG